MAQRHSPNYGLPPNTRRYRSPPFPAKPGPHCRVEGLDGLYFMPHGTTAERDSDGRDIVLPVEYDPGFSEWRAGDLGSSGEAGGTEEDYGRKGLQDGRGAYSWGFGDVES
jgi:hypothetical protein